MPDEKYSDLERNENQATTPLMASVMPTKETYEELTSPPSRRARRQRASLSGWFTSLILGLILLWSFLPPKAQDAIFFFALPRDVTPYAGPRNFSNLFVLCVPMLPNLTGRYHWHQVVVVATHIQRLYSMLQANNQANKILLATRTISMTDYLFECGSLKLTNCSKPVWVYVLFRPSCSFHWLTSCIANMWPKHTTHPPCVLTTSL